MSQILLVEEDPTLADITAFRLDLLGYSVHMVHSGEDALIHLEDQLPDLMIVDLCLPGIGGNEFLNRVSNDQRTSGVPVMVFSTSADLDDVQRAFTSGAEEYVVTPFDPAVLEQKVEKLLSKVKAS